MLMPLVVKLLDRFEPFRQRFRAKRSIRGTTTVSPWSEQPTEFRP